MEIRIAITARLGGNTLDSHLRAIHLNISAKIAGNLKRCLIISAWSISLQMRHAISKSRSDDCTLSKTL